MHVRCPQCHAPIELPSDGEWSDIPCPSCGSSFSLLGTSETIPYETGTKTIGHFELVVRELATGHNSSLSVPAETFGAATFSPDGRTLATGTSDGLVRLWDFPSREKREEFAAHRDSIRTIAYSPCGKLLVSACFAGTARISDAETGELVAPLDGHSNTIYDTAFSPDSRRIATSSADTTVRVWDSSSGTLIATLTDCADEARGVAFSKDGTLIAAGERGTVVRVWNAATYERVTSIPRFGGFQVMFLSDVPTNTRGGETLLFSSWNKRIAAMDADLEQHGNMLQLPASIKIIGVVSGTPDIFYAITHSRPMAVHRWAIRADRLAMLPTLDTGLHPSSACATQRDTIVVVDAIESQLKCFSIRQSKMTLTLPWPGADTPVSAALSPAEDKIAVSFPNGRVIVYDLKSQAITMDRPCHDGQVTCLLFHPTRSVLVTGGRDSWVKSWDVEHDQAVCEPLQNAEIVESLALSPDGNQLAAGLYNGDINIWRWPLDGSPVRLSGHQFTVTGLAFLADGSMLASAGADRVVRIWDLETKETRLGLEGDTSIFTCIAVSPHETFLAAAARDATIRFWRAATPEEVERTPGW